MKRIHKMNRLTALLIAAVMTTGVIGCSGNNTDNPMDSQVNPQAKAIAGTYLSQYRWGGADGLWRGPADLTVNADGTVTYGSKVIMNPQFGDHSLAWSMADGNAQNAAVTFQDSDNSDYYWRDKAATKMNFTGWLQNPGEGKLDFRGLSK